MKFGSVTFPPGTEISPSYTIHHVKGDKTNPTGIL